MSTTSNNFSIVSVFSLVLGAVFMTSRFHFANSQTSSGITKDFLRSCTIVPPKTSDRNTVYVDWPFTLDCKDLAASSGVPLSSTESLCLVSSKDISPQFSNVSITLDATSSQSSTYTLSQVINTSQCYSTNVTIELRHLPARSCVDDVSYYVERNVSLVYKEVLFGDELRLDCMTASSAGNEGVFPPAVPPTQYKTTWYRTKLNEDRSIIKSEACEDYTAASYKTYYAGQELNPPYPDTFSIYNAHYYFPGIFSCSVTYNDQTAFVVHYAVCVENTIERSAPTVQCNEIKHFFEEDTVEIECSVQSSNAEIAKDQLEVQWTRLDGDSSYRCQTLYLSPEQSGGHRATCDIIEFPNVPSKCFWYEPTEKELTDYQDKKTFDIKYILSNMKKSDAGMYQVKLRYGNLWSEPWNVTLTFNPARELRYIITILVSVLAVLTAIVVAIGLVWYNWIQILLFVRRHFRQPIEDNKEFVAILSYLFSSDLGEEAREHTKKIVHCIRKRMDKMNYNFYDKHEDSKGGSTVETLLKNLNHSHRMVIVLTDAYVEERWARFEAQQGYINMMKNKTKLIIVRAPGARTALQRSTERGDEFSTELMEALRASRNIRWKNNMKEERFMDDIEYALPNLKRSSSSSDENLFQFNRLESLDPQNSNQTPSPEDPVLPDSNGKFTYETRDDIV